MQSIISALQPAITGAIVALWPRIEPLIVNALVDALRRGLQALKDKTVPAESPFKPFEALADATIDEILKALAAKAS